jgi:hypothetical protein
MNLESFKESISNDAPDPGLSVYLRALWWDARGDWEAAHDLINDLSGEKAAWVHAYLHRKEGDLGNAGYWYARAGKALPAVSLKEEWSLIVAALL